MKELNLILGLGLILSCSIEHKQTDNKEYNNVIYICKQEECPKYLELKPCDGGISVEQKCEFVKDIGCDWVTKKCYNKGDNQYD